MDDAAYYADRAERAREAARSTGDLTAKRAHEQLAQLYQARANAARFAANSREE